MQTTINKTRTLLFGIGLSLIVLMLHTHIKAQDVQNWVATHGVLKHVSSRYLSSPTVAEANDWGKRKVTVKYDYSYQGTTYSGDKAIILDFIYFPTSILESLSQGDITVYVKPNAPKESILFKRYPSEAMMQIGLFALILIALAIGLPKLLEVLKKVILKAE